MSVAPLPSCTRAAAMAKGIDLRSRLDLPPTGESFVLVDEVKLFEIINNLVSNALKFTPIGFVELVVGLSVPSTSGCREHVSTSVSVTPDMGSARTNSRRSSFPFINATSPAMPVPRHGAGLIDRQAARPGTWRRDPRAELAWPRERIHRGASRSQLVPSETQCEVDMARAPVRADECVHGTRVR